MRIIFLGTNGWYDSLTGNTICTLIDADDATIILDAGYGIAKLDQYADFTKPAYLFLSHFHLDHIAGLHTICKYTFERGLTVCGEEGIESVLEGVVNHPFTLPFRDLPFTTRFVNLPSQALSLPFPAKSLPLVHASSCLGFRLQVDGRVITYCTDTGHCDNAVELARGADLLIAECAHGSGEESETWPHLNPALAARLADEAGAKALVLVHFDAYRYQTFEDREKAVTEARGYFNETIGARDGMVIEL